MPRRLVRLFVLLGVVVAAYVGLSLFDHAAHADVRSIEHIGAAEPVEAVTAGVRKAVPDPPSINLKRAAPKAHPQTVHRPAVKVPEVHPAKTIQVPKVRIPKVKAPKVRAAVVRPVRIRTSTLGQPMSDAVRDVARALVTPARTAIAVPNSPIVAKRPDLPVVQLRALPQLPVPELRLSELPQAQLPQVQLPQAQLPQAQLPASPQLPSWSQLHVRPQAPTPALISTNASTGTAVPQPLPASAQVCPLPRSPASGLSGGTAPPVAQAQSRTAPVPAPARRPADRSTSTEQIRDSGGGNVPVMGSVPSSWRPEVTAAGRRLVTDLIARGRTVRYAGPPS